MTQSDKMTDEERASRFMALYSRGTELLQAKRAREALPLLEKAYKLDETHVGVSLNLSGAYILMKKFKKAVPILQALTQLDPENGMIWTNLGAAYLGNPILAKDADQKKAIEAFEQALVHDPIAPNVAYNIGLIYRDRREYEQAVFWFDRAIRANPKDADARALLAKMQQKLDEEE